MNDLINDKGLCRTAPATPGLLIITVQRYSTKMAVKRKVGFQLWSGNLVIAFVGVRQAQSFGCACLKRKCRQF